MAGIQAASLTSSERSQKKKRLRSCAVSRRIQRARGCGLDKKAGCDMAFPSLKERARSSRTPILRLDPPWRVPRCSRNPRNITLEAHRRGELFLGVLRAPLCPLELDPPLGAPRAQKELLSATAITATISTSSPRFSNRRAAAGAPCHSPRHNPQRLPTTIEREINRGQPTTAPQRPSLAAPAP